MARRKTVPELMGVIEVCEALGVTTSNLQYVRGLPEPVCQVRATRLWLAEDINAFAEGYLARREARKVAEAKAQRAAANKARREAAKAARAAAKAELSTVA